jgi:hypothetical protein
MEAQIHSLVQAQGFRSLSAIRARDQPQCQYLSSVVGNFTAIKFLQPQGFFSPTASGTPEISQ